MVHEASLTGRPVHLFDLPVGGAWLLRGLQWIDRRMRAGDGAAANAYLNLIREAWIYPPRAPDAFHAGLLRSGRLVRLGEPAGPLTGALVLNSTERAAAAVRRLFDP
jgi:hypothetical protein